MSEKMSDSSADYVLLNRLADEFTARYRAGERPALHEYTERYPALADDIRELFPAMVEIEQVKMDHQEATEQSPAPLAPALEQLGDFRILREVGKGGMGIVYEAEQVSLGRHVALKLLPRNLLLDPRAKRRFEREAKAAARLHHTNIVPVFGVGEQDGMPYYVMQFIQGLGLDEVLEELKKLQASGAKSATLASGEVRVSRKEISAVEVARTLLGEIPQANGNTGPEPPSALAQTTARDEQGALAPRLPASSDSSLLSSSSVVLPGPNRDGARSRHGKQTYWHSVARIGVQVAEALAYAHKQGVQHRDIKPSNLLLDTQGTVWVTDFGLAKADDHQNLTHTGDILGTLRYMPPEAFEGKSEARGDIYSLGLTLYEMLAFRPAFDESERNRLIRQMLHEEPIRLGKLNPHVPRDLETIVHKATDKDPRQRYASAAALADDLQRFIDDEPIVARPVSHTERFWRWCRRNPALARLAAALAVVFLTGFVGVTWKWRDAEWQKRNAQVAERGEAKQRAIAVEQAELATREAEFSRRLLYSADIQLAHQAWDLAMTGSAQAMLARHLPQAGQEDLRGFEWRYLWRLCRDGSRLTLRGLADAITAIALSPDGRTLVTCGDSRGLLIWDLPSQQYVRIQGYLSRSAVFSPDGRTVAIAGYTSRAVHLWDVSSRCERATLPHETAVVAVALSPDGALLASSCTDGTVRLWNVAQRRELTVFHGPAQGVRCVAFSPDGLTVAAAGFDASVRLWDIPGQRAIATLEGHKAPVFGLSFSPDGKTLASASVDSTVQLWDTATRMRITTLRGQRTIVLAAAFAPDGKTLATGSGDGTIQLWNTETNALAKLLRGHSDPVGALAWAPDGKSLISACWGGTVKVWDFPTEGERDTLPAPGAGLNSVSFSPDGTILAISDSQNGTVALWDVASRQEVRLVTGTGQRFACVAFAPDRQTLATGSADNLVRLWDVSTLKQVAAFQHSGPVDCVAFSPDGKLLAAACQAMSDLVWEPVRVWERATGREVARLAAGTRARFSPDGRLLATTWGRTVALWDVATWKNVAELRAGRFGERAFNTFLFSLAFSPDGMTVAASDFEGTLCLWDLATKRQVADRRIHAVPFASLAWTPDGRRLVTSGGDGVVRLWDVSFLQKLAALAGDDGPATGPEAERLWAAAAAAAFSDNHGPITSMALSPGGNLLATAAGGETVRLWSAPPLSETTTGPDMAALPPVETLRTTELQVLGTARAAMITEMNITRTDVSAVDGTEFHVQFGQLFDDLEEGATYTVRFRARADTKRTVLLYGQINEPNWHGIGLNVGIALTEEWQPFSYDFRALNLAAVNRIKFDIGQQTGTVWVADFSVALKTQ
jgi:WD40 repeat protein/serine/threonine protein kinase